MQVLPWPIRGDWVKRQSPIRKRPDLLSVDTCWLLHPFSWSHAQGACIAWHETTFLHHSNWVIEKGSLVPIVLFINWMSKFTWEWQWRLLPNRMASTWCIPGALYPSFVPWDRTRLWLHLHITQNSWCPLHGLAAILQLCFRWLSLTYQLWYFVAGVRAREDCFSKCDWPWFVIELGEHCFTTPICSFQDVS